MSVGIIIKGAKVNPKNPLEHLSKDQLHKQRKELAVELKDQLFSKDQMNWRDCPDETSQKKRTMDYVKWKDKYGGEKKMRLWSDTNLEFKRRKEEGRLHCIDDLRKRKSVKYD